MSDIIDQKTGEILIESDTVITEKELKLLKSAKISEITLFDDNKKNDSSDNMYIEMLKNTIAKDPTNNHEEAVRLLYTHLRTGQALMLMLRKNLLKSCSFLQKNMI